MEYALIIAVLYNIQITLALTPQLETNLQLKSKAMQVYPIHGIPFSLYDKFLGKGLSYYWIGTTRTKIHSKEVNGEENKSVGTLKARKMGKFVIFS